MTFLDEHPIQFSRREVQELRDILARAYAWPDSALDLAEAAGIVPGTFPVNAQTMRELWFKLIGTMAQQGKMRALVEIAAVDPSVSAYRPRLEEMLQESPPLPASNPGVTGDWWKGAVGGRVELQRLIANRDRTIRIDIARTVARLSKSVAKLDFRYANEERGYGTGFLIQPNLVLTNHHNVFDETRGGDIKSVTVEFDYEEGIPESRRLVRSGDVASIVKNADHDWAVIRLDKDTERKPLALGSRFDIGLESPIIIIQHPLGAYKRFAIDMLSVQYRDDQVVQYLADTQKGSSGSPVFNINMQVIALHHAESEAQITVNGKQEVVWRNQGIHIQQVMNDLKTSGIEFTNNTL